MSVEKQILIYERAIPVSKQRHEKVSVDAKDHFAFAQSINAVPIVIGEFSSIAREYPIIFVSANSKVQPMAMVGLRDNENLFVSSDGSWESHYVPAFIRRYPFIFSKNEGEDKFVLCIDEEFEGFNTEGKGSALFDDEGEASDYLKKMLGFLTTYQRELQATERFSERLSDLDILSPSEISFQLGDGKKAKTRGLLSVDRDKLANLSQESLSELLSSGDLERIFAHILSLGAVDTFGSKLRERLGVPSTTGPSKL